MMSRMEAMRLLVGSWWQGEVHQMSDGSLAFTAIKWPHICRLNKSIFVCEFCSPGSLVLFAQRLIVAGVRDVARRRDSTGRATGGRTSLGNVGTRRERLAEILCRGSGRWLAGRWRRRSHEVKQLRRGFSLLPGS